MTQQHTIVPALSPRADETSFAFEERVRRASWRLFLNNLKAFVGRYFGDSLPAQGTTTAG